MLSTKGQSFVMTMIGLMMAVIVGVAVSIPTIMNTINTAANPTSTSETINFAVDDTYYKVTSTPLHTVSAMYNNATKNYQYPTGQYTVDAVNNQIKIAVNGTGDYPNMTVGNKYVEYTYEQTGYFGGDTTSIGLLRLVPLFVVLFLIIAVVGIMKLKQG